ncbi:glutathione S-transferase T2-like [Eutrema salsugineum]|uniref:glutathione S-transferase T2-like n=1 Tax=Eutrema salsugineum TaxID=72664 RepID=UPI000CECE7E2|nr:glutathione S-transferase T2-like [Eutrema salsugineum]
MESSNHYGPTEGFVNLLTSQIGNEGFSHVIDLGSSEVPVFSTPTSDEPSPVVKQTAQRTKSTPKEDVILISLAGQPSRGIGQCKQRWCRINDQVCKFVGCYEATTKEKSSGQSENDIMKAAHEIFFSNHMVKFSLENTWRELRHNQKWCRSSSLKDSGHSKRKNFGEPTSAQSVSNTVGGSNEDDVSEVRPPGVKAAKAKAKNTNCGKEEGKARQDFDSLWECKQKDLEMKARLAKHKTLDNLLAKTEPLSEIEDALKTKLINELLG